ncbi:MAG: hypothetical protein E6G08_00230 [Actinobacteria bacterium]|nr:MAG: hypothetical protein E6G08_00230 [Actinomycetota bacterium]
MRLARPGVDTLQWFGLFGAALVWTVQHVLAFGVDVARCSPANVRWGVDQRAWQIALLAVAVVLVVASEAAAVTVLRETRGVEDSDPPPDGRRHFFAVAASVGNVLFLVIILMDGLAQLALSPCRQA